MKIGYFADGPWSHLTWELLNDDPNVQIAFVVPRYDSQDPILRSYAEKNNIPFLTIKDINLEKSIKKLAGFGADLFVSMSFNQIIRPPLLSAPPLGFINCHAGALPKYRGRNVLNWAIINDEPEFGVTVHYIDEGIDTGDIIAQTFSAITDKDDYASVSERATYLCASLLCSVIKDFSKGNVRSVKQGLGGFYCTKRVDGDEVINWNWSSRRIFNFVRAITHPGPCAITTLNGVKVSIKKCEIPASNPSYIGIPGQVVGVTESDLSIKTGDGIIIVRKACMELKNQNISIGMRFSSN